MKFGDPRGTVRKRRKKLKSIPKTITKPDEKK